jgi:putative NIF3 family GTP cyclohydrolase 1 type 2
LSKVVLWTPTDPVITSLDQFEALAAPYAEMGIDQLVLHHPAQTGPYGGAVPVFEHIAERSAATGY